MTVGLGSPTHSGFQFLLHDFLTCALVLLIVFHCSFGFEDYLLYGTIYHISAQILHIFVTFGGGEISNVGIKGNWFIRMSHILTYLSYLITYFLSECAFYCVVVRW